MLGLPTSAGRAVMMGRAAAAAAAAALAVRNATSGSKASAVITTADLPTRQAGDALAVMVVTRGIGFPAANTGWVKSSDTQYADLVGHAAVYTKAASDGTDESPFLGPNVSYTYHAISVQAPTTGYDTSAGANGSGPGGTATAPTFTAASATEVDFRLWSSNSATETLTPTAGYTTVAAQTVAAALNAVAGYRLVSASGAQGAQAATGTVASSWVALSAGIR